MSIYDVSVTLLHPINKSLNKEQKNNPLPVWSLWSGVGGGGYLDQQ